MIILCKHIGNTRVSCNQESDSYHWKTWIFCPTACLFEGRFCPFGMFMSHRPLVWYLSSSLHYCEQIHIDIAYLNLFRTLYKVDHLGFHYLPRSYSKFLTMQAKKPSYVEQLFRCKNIYLMGRL